MNLSCDLLQKEMRGGKILKILKYSILYLEYPIFQNQMEKKITNYVI